MERKRFKPEQTIHMLREAEIKQASSSTDGEVCRALGVTDQTYRRWRKSYGGMHVSQARQLKALEQENAWLKKLVASQALDKAILEEALKGRIGETNPTFCSGEALASSRNHGNFDTQILRLGDLVVTRNVG